MLCKSSDLIDIDFLNMYVHMYTHSAAVTLHEALQYTV